MRAFACASVPLYSVRVQPLSEFRHVFVVAPGDIDDLGHANNVAYVRWLQDIAVAHSEAVGLDVPAYLRIGAVFVVRRHEVDYLHPAAVMAAKCHRATVITRVRDRRIVAKALTTWGFIDVARSRPTRITDEVARAFGQELARRRSGPIVEEQA
jgi:acyl-CoA thioester hydrolase